VLFNELGEGPFKCHWCDGLVAWSDLNVNHLNGEKSDNGIDNLVPAHHRCNMKRAWSKVAAAMRHMGRQVEYAGRRMCISEWARLVGISANAFGERLRRGWSVQNSIEVPRGGFGPASLRHVEAGSIQYDLAEIQYLLSVLRSEARESKPKNNRRKKNGRSGNLD
jgi:hypothetical protein